MGNTTTNNTNGSGSLVPSVFVEYPERNDVCFRRGMHLMHHPGNNYFHGLIESKVSDHETASQTDKSRITWWVVDKVQRFPQSGRFLTWNDRNGHWTRLDDESKIRSRVAWFFRASKKKKQKRDKKKVKIHTAK